MVSAPKLPEDLIATSPYVYITFHGIDEWYRCLYSEEELRKWEDRIGDLDVTSVFCHFNNDYNANAARNSRQLREMLSDAQHPFNEKD